MRFVTGREEDRSNARAVRLGGDGCNVAPPQDAEATERGVPQLSFKFDCVPTPMLARSSVTLPTRIQILLLARFFGFSRIYRRYALSSK
jgi:hypothetical protein